MKVEALTAIIIVLSVLLFISFLENREMRDKIIASLDMNVATLEYYKLHTISYDSLMTVQTYFREVYKKECDGGAR